MKRGLEQELKEELQSIKDLVVELGIPEYFAELTDREILALSFFFYEVYIRDRLEQIRADIHEGEG